MASQVAALDIGYKPGVNKMTEKPKLLFLLGAVSCNFYASDNKTKVTNQMPVMASNSVISQSESSQMKSKLKHVVSIQVTCGVGGKTRKQSRGYWPRRCAVP